MGQYNRRDKILEVFYENPKREFTIRELEKRTNIPRSTTHIILRDLKKQGLIDSENKAASTILFKLKKTNFFVEKIAYSGLIDFLIKKLNPSAIVLFGGVRKGESDKESDIDLFVETPVKYNLDLKRFERRLKHKIDLFLYDNIKDVHNDLRANIINGIKLYGYLDIK
ncbi:MAG: nucleotidyltransferase domain-containing protein [Candidatus Nanoarchaeia archaeon]